MMSVASNVRWHESSLTSAELYRNAVRLLSDAAAETEKDVILAGYNVIESVCLGKLQSQLSTFTTKAC